MNRREYGTLLGEMPLAMIISGDLTQLAKKKQCL